MIDKKSKILIVGLGLIGGSYAIKLKQLGYEVYALDIDNEALKFALDNDYIDEGSSFDPNLISKSDVIILGLYPLKALSWVQENKKYFKDKVILTDVSGVKSNYVEVIEKEIEGKGDFVSTHPMAGKEKTKVFHSDPAIFENANLIIIKTLKTSSRALDFAYDLGKLMNFRNIEYLSFKEHDEMISFLSQLPHAIAVSLMNCRDSESFHRYSGDSFKDLTRIAKINENLWSELFFLNKDILAKDIDDFIKTLEDLKNKIVSNDEEGLKELFISSTKKRKNFEK